MKETRIIFGLEDIQGVIIRCVHCGGELSANWRSDISATKAPQAIQCPHCHISWKESEDTTSINADRERVTALLYALEHFASKHYRERLSKKEAKWEVLFGLPGDTG